MENKECDTCQHLIDEDRDDGRPEKEGWYCSLHEYYVLEHGNGEACDYYEED